MNPKATLILLICLLSVGFASAETTFVLDDNIGCCTIAPSFGKTNDFQGFSRNWTAPYDVNITNISLGVRDSGANVNISAIIWTVGASKLPNGTVCQSVEKTIGEIPATYVVINFSFTGGCALTGGQEYAIGPFTDGDSVYGYNTNLSGTGNNVIGQYSNPWAVVGTRFDMAYTIYATNQTSSGSNTTAFTSQLFNNVTGASIGTVTIINSTGNLNLTFYNITSTGFCVEYVGNGTGTNCTTTGSGTSTFFNATYGGLITNGATVKNSTFQAWLQISASQLFTGTLIDAFTATNNKTSNTTSADPLYLKALNTTNNVQVAVPGNFTKNISCSISTPFVTQSCNASDIFDTWFSFNATDYYNHVGIQNFSLNISNTTLGGTLYENTTTTGLLNLSFLQNYFYFIQFRTTNDTHEFKNISLPANASNQHYEFLILPAPSINITIRDASTGALITENVTIILTSNTTGDTIYTTSGGYFATDLTPEQYTIKLSSANYSQSTYVVSALSGSVYYLTAYLQQNVSEVIMQFVDSLATSVTIEGALITQEVLVNGTWQAVSTKATDITGRTIFGYVDDIAYRFIAIATGYQTKTFTLDPVLFSTYTVKMSRSTSLDSEEDFQSVYIAYTPSLFYDGQENQINITFNSPLGTFTGYNWTVSYPGGTNTSSGNNALGETFTLTFNITGATYLDRVNVTLTYDTSLGDARTFQYSNLIVINPGNTTFIANQNNTFGLGLLDRLIIGTAIIIGFAGLTTLAAGPLWGLLMALFLMGVYISQGFWPWWAAGISFVVGFALIAGRTD